MMWMPVPRASCAGERGDQALYVRRMVNEDDEARMFDAPGGVEQGPAEKPMDARRALRVTVLIN